MRLPAAVVLACLLVGGAAAAREHHQHHEHRADALRHLEKANALAGDGKCAAALKEFTAAYEKLQDPIVLFNRAECYRRLGENAKAAEDYRGFLKGFPAAPNRAELEARIAALEKPPAPRPPAGAPRPPPAATGTAPGARPPATATAPPPPPPKPAHPTPPVAVAPAPPPPAPVEAMPFLPPPPPTGGDAKALVEAPRAPSESASPGEASTHGSRWWLWATVAVVAVGGGFAAYWFLRPKDEPLPMTSLGNYRF